ncbi:hypothetical protein [Streptomyces sp. bgisy027]|uniref:hypothetical protein n=1 Tax=unclassified Streptomyces TaxID=2593676 RepID=UPI003D72D70A
MTATNHPSGLDPLSSDPRAAHLVEAFKDALVRMRDGQDLTAKDLEVATDLLQIVQAPAGTSLAAAVMPLFREVFQGRQDGSTASEESAAPLTSGPATLISVLRSPEPRWW